MIDIIKYNPYRILNLPVTATDREINKIINKFEAYLSIGKNIVLDKNDLQFLGSVDRKIEHIKNAQRKLENEESKFYHSLFWFDFRDSVDEMGNEFLEKGDIANALKIWTKSTINNKLHVHNVSHYKNLSLLCFITIFISGEINHNNLHNAIKYSNLLFNSDLFWDKYTSNCISNIVINKKKDIIEKYFLKYLDELLERRNLFSNEILCEIFKEYNKIELNGDFDKIVINKFTPNIRKSFDGLIEETEIQIEEERNINEPNLINFIKKAEEILNEIEIYYNNSDTVLINLKDKYSQVIIKYCHVLFNTSANIEDSNVEFIKKYLEYAINVAVSVTAKHIAKNDYESFLMAVKDIDSKLLIEKLINKMNDVSQNIETSNLDYYTEGISFYKFIKPLIEELEDIFGKNDDNLNMLINSCAAIIRNLAINCANKYHNYDDATELTKCAMELAKDNELRNKLSSDYKILLSNGMMQILNGKRDIIRPPKKPIVSKVEKNISRIQKEKEEEYRKREKKFKNDVEYKSFCASCGTKVILTKDEFVKREFICPKCNVPNRNIENIWYSFFTKLLYHWKADKIGSSIILIFIAIILFFIIISLI